MKPYLIILLLMLFLNELSANNVLKIYVRDANNKQPLVGANVYFQKLKLGASTDESGFAIIRNIPDGSHILIISYVGYETAKRKLLFPLKNQATPLHFLLEPLTLNTEQIVVNSTRNNSVLANTPVRIQVLGKEEVNEEIAIRPGDISKILGESSSIVTRQTSAVSGNISFRLQGLPARYTQLLKDGFPNFSGFASGLSLLQIPPLDLKQIEITRGSYATLYANGAIAGIINLISREPSQKPQWDFILNKTSRQSTDISSFNSIRYGKAGFTFLVNQSVQKAVDVDGDGFSDIPKFRNALLHPRFFYYFDKNTSLMIGLSSFFENRSGGDIQAINRKEDSLHVYSERHSSERIGLNIKFQKNFDKNRNFTLKASTQHFKHTVSFPSSIFDGNQNYTFIDASYFHQLKQHKIVAGVNLFKDQFHQTRKAVKKAYDYNNSTIGLFVQDDWRLSEAWTAQGGLRGDLHNSKDFFFLPHVSLLFNAAQSFKFRFSSGFGYNIPTLYGIAPERDFLTYHVQTPASWKAETSRDVSLDATYRFFADEFVLTLNQVFYATQINRAIFAAPNSDDLPVDFVRGTLLAKGAETHLLLNFDELEFYVDYNYIDAVKSINHAQSVVPFTPRHKLNFTLTYEQEGNWRTGIEAFYTGRQYLNNYRRTKDFWIFGAMVEKKFNHFSLIFNVENIFDERQTKYERIVQGPFNSPHFEDIYMPLEGRIANVALWIKLK